MGCAEFGFFTVINENVLSCAACAHFKLVSVVSIYCIKCETKISLFLHIFGKRNYVKGILEPNLESMETSVEWLTLNWL